MSRLSVAARSWVFACFLTTPEKLIWRARHGAKGKIPRPEPHALLVGDFPRPEFTFGRSQSIWLLEIGRQVALAPS